MQKIYFILAVAGWIWLVIAGAAVALAMWRKRRQVERRGIELRSMDEAGR